ncbi:MAG: hypothetical protein Q9169_006345 [Polycauliona sp. 2 TL-2023]
MLTMDWTHGPGRKTGCFEPSPTAIFEPYIKRSAEEIKAEYDKYLKDWDLSPAKVDLQEHMARITNCTQFGNVISFGTGSFENPFDDVRRRSFLQVAALLIMVECISTAYPIVSDMTVGSLTLRVDQGRRKDCFVQCFAQDPVYGDADHKFLRSIGIEPVCDPDGFMMVGSDSLVCEWATYDFILRKISERPWPAALITSNHKLECPSNNWPHHEHGGYEAGVRLSHSLSVSEAEHMVHMLDSRERLSLLSFAQLCNPDPGPPSEREVRWGPWHSVIYWQACANFEDAGGEMGYSKV